MNLYLSLVQSITCLKRSVPTLSPADFWRHIGRGAIHVTDAAAGICGIKSLGQAEIDDFAVVASFSGMVVVFSGWKLPWKRPKIWWDT